MNVSLLIIGGTLDSRLGLPARDGQGRARGDRMRDTVREAWYEAPPISDNRVTESCGVTDNELREALDRWTAEQ